MPSYNKHALFSLIIALPFFPDVFYLSLAVIGASIIDMDHHLKKNKVVMLAISGFLFSFVLYMLKLPFLFGISPIAIAFIFYVSNHRGFSHSIFGVPLFSFLLAFFILGLNSLFNVFSIPNTPSLILISILLGIMVLNKRILLPYFLIASIGIFLIPNTSLNPYYTFFTLFLGGISHLMLDLFTPSGIALLKPLSSRKFYKVTGTILLILWIGGVILFNYHYLVGLIA